MLFGNRPSTTLLLSAAPQHGGVPLRVEDEHVHVVGGQLLRSFHGGWWRVDRTNKIEHKDRDLDSTLHSRLKNSVGDLAH